MLKLQLRWQIQFSSHLQPFEQNSIAYQLNVDFGDSLSPFIVWSTSAKRRKKKAQISSGNEKFFSSLFLVGSRALAQCPRQFSVFTENCLCGLDKQSGRVAKMANISTGEISGSVGAGFVITFWMLLKVPNISADLKIWNSYMEATQMVVDFLENVNKDHEN